MIIPVWVILVFCIVTAFPFYWFVLDGKNIRYYNDYIPVVCEILGYATSILVVIATTLCISFIVWAFYTIFSMLWQLDWIGLLNHEVIYIK